MWHNRKYLNVDLETQNTRMTDIFIENMNGLKYYLRRFFSSTRDIEDVLQDTYIRAIETEKVTEIHSPKAYLYKICKNLALNHHAKAAHKLTDYIADFDYLNVLDSDISLEDRTEQERRFMLFCHSVKQLPPQCRRAFVLKKVYGLTSKEIADRLNIKVSTVDKHLSKGLSLCRNYLERRGYGFNNIDVSAVKQPKI